MTKTHIILNIESVFEELIADKTSLQKCTHIMCLLGRALSK